MKKPVVRRLWSVAGPHTLALLLALPALAAGLQFDDYYHRDVLRGADSPLPAMQRLFAFLDGDPARAQALMDSGIFPWWTLPTAREAFWRPLAALTHWLDYRLWPAWPAAMHAHSLLWLAALVAAAAALYRRLAPTAAAAGLAALLYAVDDAHGFAAGWLANRNGLLAALFGMLCVHAFVRWRRDGWQPGAWLAPLWLALGLLSAEAALGATAYLLAYVVCLDTAPWRRRLPPLVPALVVVAAWTAAYRALGYGAWGTAYVDPLREPLAFAAAVFERGPVLLLGQFAYPPAELYPFLGPAARLAVWGLGAAAAAALAWLLAPLLRRSPTARFWALGMLLALIPICAALPANRLLFFVGLGAMGLLAEYLANGTRNLIPAAQRSGTQHASPPASLSPPRSGVRRFTHHARIHKIAQQRSSIVRHRSSVVLLTIHLLLAPLLLPLTAYSPALLGNIEPAALSVAAAADDTVVLLNAPSFFSASFLGTIRAAHGLPVPARVRSLGAGPAALEVSRPAARTLIVRPAGGYITGFDAVFRGLHHPLALGEMVALDGMQVEVLALTPDGRPAAAAFRFVLPLEAGALRWYRWEGGVFVPFTLPAIGEVVNVPPLPLFLPRPPL